MFLHSIPKRKNRKMPGKRIGRGVGSGVGGHTATRGQKGQKSRSGHKSMVMFEGGNVPFHRRMPKYRGFTNTEKVTYHVVNLSVIEGEYKSDEIVSLETLKAKGIIRKRAEHVKILGTGDLSKKLNFEGLKISEAARAKIQAAKGSIK